MGNFQPIFSPTEQDKSSQAANHATSQGHLFLKGNYNSRTSNENICCGKRKDTSAD